MSDLEVVRLSRAEAARILAAGARAGAEPDTPATACPYSPTGDASERVRVAAWVRGYVTTARRPPRIGDAAQGRPT